MYDLFFVGSRTDSNFIKLKERFPLIKSVQSFQEAQKKSFTKFFWCVWHDVNVLPDFKFDFTVSEYDKEYIHVFLNGEHKDGICIFPKNKTVSDREIKYRFFASKKELEIQASIPRPYDKFYINTYEEYLKAVETSNTEMFYVITRDLVELPDFKFDLYFSYHNQYDRKINHIFRNGIYYDGIILATKNKIISKNEFDHKFLLHKKEWDLEASTPKPFDIVFISYNESNADENFKLLQSRFPGARRVHGVKGIHQAHLAAAKLATTDMFWVVDGDAVIVPQFNFEFPQLSKHDAITSTIVHVWRSRNPINGLEYGYGGVKLLPRKLVLNMDLDSIDMTTSISKNFKAMPEVSNITAFNTDPFSAYRSAFRECCKLALLTDTESLARLKSWCALVSDAKYGYYSYLGALAGRHYAEQNASNKEALRKINDFDWINQQFQQSRQLKETLAK